MGDEPTIDDLVEAHPRFVHALKDARMLRRVALYLVLAGLVVLLALGPFAANAAFAIAWTCWVTAGCGAVASLMLPGDVARSLWTEIANERAAQREFERRLVAADAKRGGR